MCTISDKGNCCESLKLRGLPLEVASASSTGPKTSADRTKSKEPEPASELNVEPEPASEPTEEPKATKEGGLKKSVVLKSAIAKVKTTLLASLDEQKKFRKFLKPLYATPGEAYEAFAEGAPYVDRERFLRKAEVLKFPGSSEKVFSSICDSQGHITKKAFQHALKHIGTEGSAFTDVVKHAVVAKKNERAPAKAPHAQAAPADGRGSPARSPSPSPGGSKRPKPRKV